ncbi:hypothetical protein G7045_09505 [Acidovorax sp. HDW3]|uniref:LuxR C-terminal-related transcriptional regulator n=1 Tax=Acidovorax sp. HDW3 TaxID=2714923 RepID=UPI00140B9C22|nr:LuxR C-terminal-related transcriptional regulator [Acidovorax sp. HDW3]QIL44477.1 hypothetical protein G7045_09505 [Acidovorax sp. HDW3]
MSRSALPHAPTPAPFLRPKLRVLRPPHGSIARPRLEALRAQALQVPLVTLTAPGGFGKSTLAAAWVAQWQAEGQHCSWLSLSPDDDEPARFLHAFTQALQRLGQGVGDAALALLQGRALAAPRAVLALLLNDLEDFDGEAIVVLDDWQWLHDGTIHDALAFFITHAPPQLHLLITSRSTPALPLARLRAHGQWLEVDASALRFDRDETARLLGSVGLADAHGAQADALHASTEGWPAALRLAALGQRLGGSAGPASTGQTPAFATLLDDVLQSLPPATLRFLAQSAVLERLTPTLCNAVCQAQDSSVHLALLLQHHLLNAPMDSEGQWLRPHQLLREHLLAQVAPRLGLDLAQLHLRAAHGFAAQGQWSDAVRHALQAGAQAQAIEWLAHCGMALVKTGDLLTLLAWRRQLPPELLANQPRVQLAVAWGLALAMRGAESEALRADIERSAQARLQGAALDETLGECLAIRAINAALQDDSLQAGVLARQWHARTHHSDTFTRNALGNVMRYVHWKAGDMVQVYEQPWISSSADEERHNAFSSVYRHTLLGSIELQKARLGLAERHAREALRCAHQHGGALSVSAALAAPLMASLHALQGRWAQALELLTPLLPLIDHTAMHESAIQAYQVLVRAAAHQGQQAHAFELIERAEALGYNRGWDRLVGHMLHERLRLLLAEGRLDEASATCIRLQRLTAHAETAPLSTRAELHTLRDMALAWLALAQQRADNARQLLAPLLQAAQESAHDLPAIRLGVQLALAAMAAGEQEACFTQLRQTLRAVQHSGAPYAVLGQHPDVPALLARFVASRQCDGTLADFTAELLAHGHSNGSSTSAGTRAPSPNTTPALTERECAIVTCVARGLSNKEIARTMAISSETVKTHLKNIFDKLGVQQRAQAARVAQTLGLV